MISDATVFVYQSVDGGAESLYRTITTDGASVDVELLFNDSVEYTYRFVAYANMGCLAEAPDRVLFSDESRESFQMHGELSGVDQSASSSATVNMERYVGKVSVNSVSLQWKESVNASQPFTLKRIYLANTAEEYGGAAGYNVGGVLESGTMDALLVSEVDAVIENGGSYSVPRYLYGYGSASSALVLECEWAGQTMYYHLDCALSSNTDSGMTLSIHQTGSDEPLGDITDDALTKAGALEASAWDVNSISKTFATPKAPVGASIYGVDGNFYTADEWTASGKQSSEAVGVAVSDGDHSFVIHPTAERPSEWSRNETVAVSGVVTTTDQAIAEADFAGEANTAAILAAVEAGTIEYAPAAQYAAGITFANGRNGYLPSAGELNLINENISDINTLLTVIDGQTLTTMYTKGYAASTQFDEEKHWCLITYTGELFWSLKAGSANVYYSRAVAAL